jgi:hypothetical protein
MEFTTQQIRAFRFWIQGYQNFYEPIITEWFKIMGYTVIAHPAVVKKPDIQRIIDALYDGRKLLGRELDNRTIENYLRSRSRLQPDLLLQHQQAYYLAELKSWGGYRSGVFDLDTARAEFIQKPENAAFLLVDEVNSCPIKGKILVVSARSADPERVLNLLRTSFNTPLQLFYLDEMLQMPQLAGIIDRQLRYLDAAVAELRQALGGNPK